MKKILKYVIAFIILIISFNLLLFFGSLFPSNIIEENVKESSEILSKEGGRYRVGRDESTVNDNYTDALIINESYSIDNKNPIYSYMMVRKNYKENQTQKQIAASQGEGISVNEGKINQGNDFDTINELEEFLDGKTEISVEYARYWHGYLPFFRVLLIFMNITQIRYFLLILFIILLIYAFITIKNKIDMQTAIIFVYSLIAIGFFYVSYSLECAPVFIVMMLASIILLKNIEKIKDFYLYIFIIACITNFVDYLTTPLITVGMPLYLYILYIQKNKEAKTLKYYCKIILKAFFIWLIGYASTWFTKWLFCDFLYNQGIIKATINQVIYRCAGGNLSDNKQKLISFLIKLVIINIYYAIAYMIVIMYIFIYKFTISKMCWDKWKKCIKEKLPMLIISITPLIWFTILTNHTVGDGAHGYRFSHRNILIFLFGIMIFIKQVFTFWKKEEKQS